MVGCDRRRTSPHLLHSNRYPNPRFSRSRWRWPSKRQWPRHFLEWQNDPTWFPAVHLDERSSSLLLIAARLTRHDWIGVLGHETQEKNAITTQISISKCIEQTSLVLRHRQFSIDAQMFLQETATAAITHVGQPNENAVASGTGQEDQPEPVESKDTFVVQVHWQSTLNLEERTRDRTARPADACLTV